MGSPNYLGRQVILGHSGYGERQDAGADGVPPSLLEWGSSWVRGSAAYSSGPSTYKTHMLQGLGYLTCFWGKPKDDAIRRHLTFQPRKRLLILWK